MSALLATPPHLSLELRQDRIWVEPGVCCRFCNCNEEKPCVIPVREDEAGDWYLARTEVEATLSVTCFWFLPGICNAPECMAKLYAELRGEPQFVVFSAGDGRCAR
jgi:hypothetical protein